MRNYPITDTCSIYKLIRSGNTESYNTTPAYTNVDATISPANTDIQTSDGGVYSYQLYEVFIWDMTVTINNGDKIVSQDGTRYMITGSPNKYNNRFIQANRTLAKVII